MSSLGLLIYFVGLSETVSSGEGWVIALFVLGSVIITVVRLVVLFDTDSFGPAERASYGKHLFRWSMVLYFGLFISIVIQFIIPSKQTAIFIAASEVSQRALQTDQAKAIGEKVSGVLDPSVQLLTTWIKKEQVKQQNQLDDIEHDRERDRNARRN